VQHDMTIVARGSAKMARFPNAKRPGHSHSSGHGTNWPKDCKQIEGSRVSSVGMLAQGQGKSGHEALRPWRPGRLVTNYRAYEIEVRSRKGKKCARRMSGADPLGIPGPVALRWPLFHKLLRHRQAPKSDRATEALWPPDSKSPHASHHCKRTGSRGRFLSSLAGDPHQSPECFVD
jgi:hypothetical protein